MKTENSDEDLFKGFTNKMAVVCAVIALVIIFIGVSFYSANQHCSKLLNTVNKNYATLEVSMNKRYQTVPKLVKTTQTVMRDDEVIFAGINTARASYKGANTPVKKMEANTQIGQETGSLINSITIKHPKLAKEKRIKKLVNELNISDNTINSQQLKYNASVKRYNKAVDNPTTFIFVKLLGYKTINSTIALS